MPGVKPDGNALSKCSRGEGWRGKQQRDGELLPEVETPGYEFLSECPVLVSYSPLK